jgi:hypothetical protein
MLSGWSRALVWIAAAALLAAVPCYGNCAMAARGCHHHKSPPQDQGCPHRHSEFAAPEPAVAGVSVTGAVSPVLVSEAAPRSAIEPLHPLPPRDGSPPGGNLHSAIPVLRL